MSGTDTLNEESYRSFGVRIVLRYIELLISK